MNIEIANRLVELRKKSGLSQEELADKLGLSRQAVSKWERAESSPDTDNLICLAKLYNVSLDDLLNTDQSVEEIREEVKDKKASEDEFDEMLEKTIENKIKDKIKNKYANLSEKDQKRAKTFDIVDGIITGALFLIATIVYIAVSCYHPEQWGKLWIVYLVPMVLSSILTCFKKRRITPFLYPVAATVVYLICGLYFNFWHPSWLVFVTIPVFYTIFGPIDKLIADHRHEPVDPEDEDDEDED